MFIWESQMGFTSGFATDILFEFLIFPLRVACPPYIVFLNLVTLTISYEEYKS
jgi:hypothetical protein